MSLAVHMHDKENEQCLQLHFLMGMRSKLSVFQESAALFETRLHHSTNCIPHSLPDPSLSVSLVCETT